MYAAGDEGLGEREGRVGSSMEAQAAAAAASAAPSDRPRRPSTRCDSLAVPMRLIPDRTVPRARAVEQPVPTTPDVVKWQTMPRNFYAYFGTLIAAFLILVLGIVASMTLLQRSASAHNSALQAQEADAGAEWAMNFRTAMIDALAITRSLQDFVVGTFPSLIVPHHVDNVTKTTNFLTNFARYAALLAELNPTLAIMTVAPGGIMTMTYPYDPASIGRNLFSPTDPANQFSPTPMQTVEMGVETFTAPSHSTIAALHGIWVVLARIPIFNNTQSSTRTLANFWGFVSLSVNVSGLLTMLQLQSSADGLDMDYVLFTTPTTTTVSIVATSFPTNLTNSEAKSFVADSTVTDVISPFSTLQIAVRSRKTYASLTPTNITLIIMWTLFGSLVLFAVAAAIIMICTKEYDAARSAPKLAPFAMLTIGPYRGTELWDTAPEQMAEVCAKLTLVLRRQMERHGAYPIQPESPFTACYTTRHVSSAVQMAFSVIDELQRHPIDGPLRAVLGEDAGRLKVGCAVHWCTDAAVRVESLQGSYRYEGPDVVFGGRMWAFAAPSAVTVSAAVVARLPCHGLAGVKAHAYQTVDLVRRPHTPLWGGSTARAELTAKKGTPSMTPDGSAIDQDATSLYLLLCSSRPHQVAAAADAIAATVMCGPTLMFEGLSDSCASVRLHTRTSSVASATDAASSPPEQEATRSPISVCSGSTVREGAAPSTTRLRAGATRVLRDHAPPPRSSVTQNALDGGAARAEAGPVAEGAAPRSPHWGGNPALWAVRVLRLSPDLATESSSESGSERRAGVPEHIPADAVTRALLQPLISRCLELALFSAFQYQAIRAVSYAEVRTVAYYFHASYKILFRPLAAPERHNIFRRLVTAFGVPQQGILEHLAVRAAAHWLLEVRKLHKLAQAWHMEDHRGGAARAATMPVTLTSDAAQSSASQSMR